MTNIAPPDRPARHSPAGTLGGLLVVGLLFCLSISSVTSAEDKVPNETYVATRSPASGLQPRGETVEVETVAPLAIDPEMVLWTRNVIAASSPPQERLRLLSRALLDEPQFRLDEIVRPTYTARQAFSLRQANCVSYAALFVGLAREMGIPAFFVLIDTPAPTGHRRDLDITEGHLAAAWGTADHQWRIYDFAGETTLSPDRVEAVTDLTAMALYASNRGIEALLEGDNHRAVAWLEHAAHLDPGLVETWTNLGVAQRHLGNLEAAQEAYETALLLDPGSEIAYRNLAVLLRLDGRQHEASEILDLAEDFRRDDALGFLDLANTSLVNGDLTTARGFYRRALRLSQRPR